MSEIVPSSGTFAYGGFPDIDELYKRQLTETDPEKREAMLHQIQKTLHERTRFAPIFDYFWPSGHRAARRGGLADEDRSVSVVGAAGGCAAEAAVTGTFSRTGGRAVTARAVGHEEPMRNLCRRWAQFMEANGRHELITWRPHAA